jgi:outer membrane protein assembly factor BamA
MVQLQILATEPPPRNLEYGISRSLYTGSWEGEVDFQHSNLLGGGETLGLSIRRGTKDAEPSVRLKYCDDHFGMEGGYDVELFSDYIGEVVDRDVDDANDQEKLGDTLLDRRGMTVSLRNPVDPGIILHSTASANVERTVTREGHQEGIVSGALGVGPFRKELPMDARSNFIARVSGGTRIADVYDNDEAKERMIGYKVLPYTIASATTRQIFPFTVRSGGRRPICLALSHCLTGSSPNIPPHEAAALGVAAAVRGGDPCKNPHVSSSLVGTTELRIPLPIPIKKPIQQDAAVVLFADWVFSQRNYKSPFVRKSSVGIGLRKTLQGIPCKYDLCFTQDGKVKGNFGLGRDFDV